MKYSERLLHERLLYHSSKELDFFDTLAVVPSSLPREDDVIAKSVALVGVNISTFIFKIKLVSL